MPLLWNWSRVVNYLDGSQIYMQKLIFFIIDFRNFDKNKIKPSSLIWLAASYVLNYQFSLALTNVSN